MSEPELAALREYLQENLDKGFIYYFTFPVGSPVHLVVVLVFTQKCAALRALKQIKYLIGIPYC